MSVIGISEEEIAQPLEYLNSIVTSLLDSFKTHPLSAKLLMLVAQTQIASNLPDTIQQVAKDLATSEGFESLVKEGQVKGVIREGDASCFIQPFKVLLNHTYAYRISRYRKVVG